MKMNLILANHATDAMGLAPRQAEEIRRAFVNARAATELTARGRGPGAGPDATPYNVTLMLLAAWSGAERKFSPPVAMALHATGIAMPDGNGPVAELVSSDAIALPAACGLTGAWSFGVAVQRIMADASLAERIDRIEVRRGSLSAVIVGTDGTESRFAEGVIPRHGMHVLSVVDGATLAALARAVAGGESV